MLNQIKLRGRILLGVLLCFSIIFIGLLFQRFYSRNLDPKSTPAYSLTNVTKSAVYDQALKDFLSKPSPSLVDGKIGEYSILKLNGSESPEKNICIISRTRYTFTGLWSESFRSSRINGCDVDRFLDTNLSSIQAQLHHIPLVPKLFTYFSSVISKEGPYLSTYDSDPATSNFPFFYIGVGRFSLSAVSHVSIYDVITNPQVAIGAEPWSTAEYVPVESYVNASSVWEKDTINLILVDKNADHIYLLVHVDKSWFDDKGTKSIYLTDVINQVRLPKGYALHLVRLTKPYIKRLSVTAQPSIALVDSLQNIYTRANDLQFEIIF
jgi:hypothetical protein